MDISHLSLGAVFVVFLGGVLSFFSPCVAPLVPGYISFLSGAAYEEETTHTDEAESPGERPQRETRTGASAPASPRLTGGAHATNMSGASMSLALPRSVLTGHAHSLVQRRRAAGMVTAPRPQQSHLSARATAPRVAETILGGLRRVKSDSVMLASLLFVLGFSVAFIIMGLLVGSFGTLLAAYQPVMQTVAGIFMVLMGAFLLNLMPRAVGDFLLRDGRFTLSPRSLRSWGAARPVAFGVVFAAGWSPCIGPVLGAVLAYAGTSGSVFASGVLLSVYSLGFAVPFLAVGLGWSAGLRALGWIKRYGHAVSTVSGVVLILVGIIYLTGWASLFATWASRMPLPWGL